MADSDPKNETEQTEQTEQTAALGTAEFRATKRLARDLRALLAASRKTIARFGKHPTVRGATKSAVLETVEKLREMETEAAGLLAMASNMVPGIGVTDDEEAAAFAEGYREYAMTVAEATDFVTAPEDATVIPSREGDGAHVEAFLWISAEDVEDDEDEDEDEDDDFDDEDEDDLDFDDEDDEDLDDEDEDEDEDDEE